MVIMVEKKVFAGSKFSISCKIGSKRASPYEEYNALENCEIIADNEKYASLRTHDVINIWKPEKLSRVGIDVLERNKIRFFGDIKEGEKIEINWEFADIAIE
jgi:hypothetical protein